MVNVSVSLIRQKRLLPDRTIVSKVYTLIKVWFFLGTGSTGPFLKCSIKMPEYNDRDTDFGDDGNKNRRALFNK